MNNKWDVRSIKYDGKDVGLFDNVYAFEGNIWMFDLLQDPHAGRYVAFDTTKSFTGALVIPANGLFKQFYPEKERDTNE